MNQGAYSQKPFAVAGLDFPNVLEASSSVFLTINQAAYGFEINPLSNVAAENIIFYSQANNQITAVASGNNQMNFNFLVQPGYVTMTASATVTVSFTSPLANAEGIYEGPYVKYLQQLSPPWLRSDAGKRWMQAHGDGLDAISDLMRDALTARMILLAPEDGLIYIGSERGMPKYAAESTEEYRFRLLAAWDYWQWGGTKKGVQDVLAIVGYTVEIIELYTIDPLKWSEFAITVAPIAGLRKRLWGDEGTWGDGGLWGQGWAPMPDELEMLASLVAGMKAAHTKMSKLEWFSEPTYNRWGDGGTWGDGGNWPNRTEVVYA